MVTEQEYLDGMRKHLTRLKFAKKQTNNYVLLINNMTNIEVFVEKNNKKCILTIRDKIFYINLGGWKNDLQIIKELVRIGKQMEIFLQLYIKNLEV